MIAYDGRRPITSMARTLAWMGLMAVWAPLAAGTSLDDYVAAPDGSYKWELVNTVSTDKLDMLVVDMTSQTWRTPDEVDRTAWQHWVTILVPKQVDHSTALMFIGGGSNGRPAPSRPNEMLAQFALATRSVVAEVHQIPNQPLVFAGEERKRVEDEMIAYTWDKFRETGDAMWPARLPMTKAVVRAMDTVQTLLKQERSLEVQDFVVAGGSKRGWTTWATAAVDPRVKAIVPIVIDVLSVRPSMKHHHAAYGFWAPAIGDYVEMNLMEWLDTPEFDALMAIADPYSYRKRYTMPKFLINSAGDQFFLPDSSQFYFDDLPGEKYLRYVPNSDHGLDDTDAPESFLAWYAAILNDVQRPKFSWKTSVSLGEATVRVKTRSQPAQVNLWQATNPTARDFRLESFGPHWHSVRLEPARKGLYVAKVPAPAEGWTALFVELVFDPGSEAVPAPFKFTTNVVVVPDVLPFPETDEKEGS